MADDDVNINVERDMVTVRVRNLVAKYQRRSQDLIDFEPLSFNFDIALTYKPGKDEKIDERKQKKMLADLANKTEYIIDQVKKKVEREVTDVYGEVDKLYSADQSGDENAYKKAVTVLKNGIKKIDDLVDSGAPLVRKMLEKELRDEPGYDTKKLHTVGNWGFRTANGMKLAPGKFQSVSADDNEANDTLAANIKLAKQAAGSSSPYQFVLALGKDAGLMIKKRLTSADIADAKERRSGGSGVVFGDILMDRTKFMFRLDKDCSTGTGTRYGKMIQKALKDATGKTFALKVVGEGWGEDEDGDDA